MKILLQKLYIAVLLLLTCFTAYGQQEILRNGEEHSRAKIYFSPTKNIKVRKLTLHNDSYITYYERATDKLEQISIMDMKMVSVKKGSHIFSYSLGGAVVGLGLSYLSSQTLIQFPVNGEFNQTNYMIGFVVGTTLIGAIIGALNPMWENLYVDKTKIKSRAQNNITPILSLNKQYKTLGFKIKF